MDNSSTDIIDFLNKLDQVIKKKINLLHQEYHDNDVFSEKKKTIYCYKLTQCYSINIPNTIINLKIAIQTKQTYTEIEKNLRIQIFNFLNFWIKEAGSEINIKFSDMAKKNGYLSIQGNIFDLVRYFKIIGTSISRLVEFYKNNKKMYSYYLEASCKLTIIFKNILNFVSIKEKTDIKYKDNAKYIELIDLVKSQIDLTIKALKLSYEVSEKKGQQQLHLALKMLEFYRKYALLILEDQELADKIKKQYISWKSRLF